MARTKMQRVSVWLGAWILLISGLQLSLNFDWSSFLNDWLPVKERKIHVAYLPVT